MRKTALSLFLVVVSAAATPALAGVPTPYTSAALGFSAKFPLPVQEKVESNGAGTAAGADPAGIMYMVAMIPPSDAALKKSIKDQLDDGIAGAVDKVHGKLVSQKNVKYKAFQGREAEIELEGAHATFRFFVIATRAYLIGVVHKDGMKLPMTPAAFFATFSLNPPAAPAQANKKKK